MNLDIPTLMVMQSFAMASAGAVLIFAWLQHRSVPALGLWAVADLVAAAGIIALMLGFAMHQPAWSALGGFLMPCQSALMWKAGRSFHGKPAPILWVLLPPAAVTLAGGLPALQSVAGTLSLTLGAAFTFAIAAVFWLGREEHLRARGPLIGLSMLHGAILSAGAYGSLTGSAPQDAVPEIMSFFGVIYFESIIFTLGTSVFIFALAKERNEAASLSAARTDPLTGIANRAAFMAGAVRMLERCRCDATPVAAMTFDLDRFKAINDRHGHAVGDTVIKKFCEVTVAALRPTDLFARMGGEEFVVLLPSVGIEAACMRAERIRISFADNCRFVEGRALNATVSGGVAVSANGTEALKALLESSDLALYAAKEEGRNRIRCADEIAREGGSSEALRIA